MKKSRKKFIKKAHSAACSEWKKNIEAEFPNLFEAKSFKKGDWVVTRSGSVINAQRFIGGSHLHGYGVNFRGNWVDDYIVCPDSCRLATKEEVSQALIAEAKKRGFKKGVKVNPSRICRDWAFIVPILTDDFKYRSCVNSIDIDGWAVFRDGKWAEIVETITKEQAEKELGKTITG